MSILNKEEDYYRSFAKRYIVRRLDEDKNDAIEELSAYLGNWLHTQQRLGNIFDERSKLKDTP